MPKIAFSKLIIPNVIIVLNRPNNSKNDGNIDPRTNWIAQTSETDNERHVWRIWNRDNYI